MTYISTGTTDFSNVSLYGSGGLVASRISSSNTAQFPSVWASAVSASNVTVYSAVSAAIVRVSGGAVASAGSLDLRTNTVVVSLDTRASASGMTTGELRIVFLSSGISLVYSSGRSSYVLGQSTQSALQA